MRISDIKKLINPEELFKVIDQYVVETNCSYVDAVLHYCDVNNVEYELIAALIKSNPSMKKKVKDCSVNLFMVTND